VQPNKPIGKRAASKRSPETSKLTFNPEHFKKFSGYGVVHRAKKESKYQPSPSSLAKTIEQCKTLYLILSSKSNQKTQFGQSPAPD
jgi:hypothetical protein